MMKVNIRGGRISSDVSGKLKVEPLAISFDSELTRLVLAGSLKTGMTPENYVRDALAGVLENDKIDEK